MNPPLFPRGKAFLSVQAAPAQTAPTIGLGVQGCRGRREGVTGGAKPNYRF
jgi:hypothetical protein